MVWQSIDSAPKDGTVLRVKTASGIASDMWSFRAKWLHGKWFADFGNGKDREEWKPFDPQPLFWKPNAR